MTNYYVFQFHFRCLIIFTKQVYSYNKYRTLNDLKVRVKVILSLFQNIFELNMYDYFIAM